MQKFAVLLIAALAAPSLIAAVPMTVPRPRDVIPRDATHLALDETTGQIIAYDSSGNEIERVASDNTPVRRENQGGCGQLSKEDVQKLPGWKAIEDYANDKWGKGSRNIVTNPEEYLDRPAMYCIKDNEAILTADAKPSCQKSTSTADAQAQNTNGTVSLSYQSGSSYETSNTVTKANEFGISKDFTAGIKIAEVLDLSSTTTLSYKFTNTVADTKTASQNSVRTATANMAVPDGKSCHLDWEVSQCTLEGKGKVPFEATGWVWFNYEDRTHDHYKWAVNMDAAVKKREDRTTYMEFKSMISSTMNANAVMKCDKGPGPTLISTIDSNKVQTIGASSASSSAPKSKSTTKAASSSGKSSASAASSGVARISNSASASGSQKSGVPRISKSASSSASGSAHIPVISKSASASGSAHVPVISKSASASGSAHVPVVSKSSYASGSAVPIVSKVA